jgi:Molybdopterin oxidoreductase
VPVLFVVGGNPVTSLPDTTRLEAAFARLDALAVADVIAADTVRHATHVLPDAGQLEREDVTWFTDCLGCDRVPVLSPGRAPGYAIACRNSLVGPGNRRTLTATRADPDPVRRTVVGPGPHRSGYLVWSPSHWSNARRPSTRPAGSDSRFVRELP